MSKTYIINERKWEEGYIWTGGNKMAKHKQYNTLKSGIPAEDGDSILKLLPRVSHPEIQLGVGIDSELPITLWENQLWAQEWELLYSP